MPSHLCRARRAFPLGLLVVGLLSLRPVHSAAADSPAWHTDVSTAWQRALDEDRPLLMFISSQSCGHCRKMKATTYANHEVARLMDESVVAVAVDAQHEHKLISRHLVRAYPTTLVIAPDGREVGRFVGYLSPDDFRRRLTQAVDKAIDYNHVAAIPGTQTR